VLQFDSILFMILETSQNLNVVFTYSVLNWIETELCHFFRKKMRLQGQLHLCSHHRMCLHFYWLPRRSSLHSPHLSLSSSHQNVCSSFHNQSICLVTVINNTSEFIYFRVCTVHPLCMYEIVMQSLESCVLYI
jgi:hypothetical protein